MTLNQLLQSGPFPHPSTQGGSAGLYFAKAHDQREQDYYGPSALLSSTADIPGIRLIPTADGLFIVYQYWVHQNPGT